jgi:hypothetical protein
LALAEQQDRVVITADLDFPRLLALSAAKGAELDLVPRREFSDADVIKRIAGILSALPAKKLAGDR